MKNILNNQSGSAIVYSLIAMIGLGALTTVLMDAKKTSVKQQVKLSSDRDMERALTILQSLVVTPANCSANFAGQTYRPAAANPNAPQASDYTTLSVGIKKSGGSEVLRYNRYDVFAEDPNPAAGQNAFNRVKISSLKYFTVSGQTTGASRSPAIIRLEAQFTKLTGRSSTGAEMTTVSKVYQFDIPVVVQTFTASNTLTPSSPVTIIGCARSQASTIAY